jgi:hypothetical protein
VEVLTESFVVAEGEGLVFLERTAEGATELIALERRDGRAIEVVAGIERTVAKEFKGGAMKLVAAALGDDEDLCAGALAVFGGVRVAQHIELADGIDPEQFLTGSARLHIVFSGAGELHTVEEEEILLRAIAGDGEVVADGGIGDADAAGLFRSEVDDAGIESEEQVEASPVQGQVLHLVFADEAGDVGGRETDCRGIGADGDLLADVADVELEIGRRVLADVEMDSGAKLVGKAVVVGGDLIIADGQREKLVKPAGIGIGGANGAGVEVLRGDGGAGQGGAGGIGDEAREAGSGLRAQSRERNEG